MPQIKLFFLLISFSCAYSHAAVVTKISKKKRIVIIDEGKNQGFKKGNKVCIYSNDKKITCSRIYKVKSNKSYLKVRRKKVKKVKVGMEARNMGKSASSSAGLGAYLQFQYLLTAQTPTIYQKLAYLRPLTETVESLWSPAGPSSLSILGMATEVGFNLGLPMSIGGRVSFYREFTSQADYDDVQENFAEINQVAQAVGAWYEIYPHNINFGGSYLFFGYGIDFESSTVTIAGAKKSDSGLEEKNIDATSNVTALSFRFTTNYMILFDPIGITFGLTAYLPLSTSDAAVSAEFIDENTSKIEGGSEKAVDALKKSLNHTSNSFGLAVTGSLFFAF